jgi:hypothetical protein
MIQDQLTARSKPVPRAFGGSPHEQPNSVSMRITVNAIAGMSSGSGYVALAAVILDSWHADQALSCGAALRLREFAGTTVGMLKVNTFAVAAADDALSRDDRGPSPK